MFLSPILYSDVMGKMQIYKKYDVISFIDQTTMSCDTNDIVININNVPIQYVL